MQRLCVGSRSRSAAHPSESVETLVCTLFLQVPLRTLPPLPALVRLEVALTEADGVAGLSPVVNLDNLIIKLPMAGDAADAAAAAGAGASGGGFH